jgi:hypothetical protein
MKHEANVGGILAELLSLVGDAGRDVALYILVVGGLTAVGVLAGFSETTAGVLNYGFSVGTDDTPASALFELFAAIVGIVAIYLLLTRLLAARGRLATGGGRFWPYLGMAIVSTIAVVLGLFMLIIPGVVLLVRWSAASGFLIGAGEGVTDSLGASWDATEGHGWAIFFAGLIVSVGVLVGSVIIGVLLAFTSEQVVAVVSAFIEAASGAVFAAFGVAIYCLVHDAGEDLSEVFA